MPLDKDTQHFLQLLCCGLKTAPPPATGEAVSPESWEHIYRTAVNQRVCAITWDGVQRLPANRQPPRELRLQWALAADELEKRYLRQRQTASALAARFAENGLRMLVLKGVGLSEDYPIPAHRECGDIDIYSFGKAEQADRVLQKIGAQLYCDVPKHSEYLWLGVQIENHRTLLNVKRNRTEQELNALLTGLLYREGTHEAGNGMETPPATFNAIFLIRHAAVHFPKEGIVLRHLCDWACFLERHWPEVDHRQFESAMAAGRMERFAALMTAAAVRYLGAGVPEPEHDAARLERFMQEVFTAGPVSDKPLAKLYRKFCGPLHNRWRLRYALRTPLRRFYWDTLRAQWNEKFTVFK